MLSEIAEIQALTKHLSNGLENEYLVTVRNCENGKANFRHRKMTDASWRYLGLLQLSTQKGPNPTYTPANNKKTSPKMILSRMQYRLSEAPVPTKFVICRKLI